MRNHDARKLTSEVQQHNRELAIRLYLQGNERKEIADIAGVHYGLVCRWIRAREEGGDKAIGPKKRDSPSGEKRLLTKEHENKPKQLLYHKSPKNIKECLGHNYPEIKKLAKKEGTTTFHD